MYVVVLLKNVLYCCVVEFMGGIVLNIESDFFVLLVVFGDCIVDMVVVVFELVGFMVLFYKKSFCVQVDGEDVGVDFENGYVYDEFMYSIWFQGMVKKKVFVVKIDIIYEEYL